MSLELKLMGTGVGIIDFTPLLPRRRLYAVYNTMIYRLLFYAIQYGYAAQNSFMLPLFTCSQGAFFRFRFLSIPPKFNLSPPPKLASSSKVSSPGGYYCIYLVEKYPPLAQLSLQLKSIPPQGRILHKDLQLFYYFFVL